MDRPTYETLIDQVESRYRERREILDNHIHLLDEWRSGKVRLLDVAYGRMSPDDWLNDMPILPEHFSTQVPTQGVSSAGIDHQKRAVNQSKEIRAAINAMPGDFTSETIREWIGSHRSDISELIKPASIRAQLGRLAESGDITQVGTSEGSHMRIFRRTRRDLLGT